MKSQESSKQFATSEPLLQLLVSLGFSNSVVKALKMSTYANKI